jgi:hypothetical protein
MHGISWAGGKWQVRLYRGKCKIIDRHYTNLDVAIEARDYTLANGKSPPARRSGRPLGSRNKSRRTFQYTPPVRQNGQ